MSLRELQMAEDKHRDALRCLVEIYVNTNEHPGTKSANVISAWQDKLKADPDAKPSSALEFVASEYVPARDRNRAYLDQRARQTAEMNERWEASRRPGG